MFTIKIYVLICKFKESYWKFYVIAEIDLGQLAAL